MKAILVTTKHRGVFFGYAKKGADLSKTTLSLKKAKMCIYWRNGNGVMGLAKEGPVGDCKVGSEADIDYLHDVTAVFSVTKEAESVWKAA